MFDAASEKTLPTPESQTSKGGKTILVVDDEESVLKVTKAMLERLGYKVKDFLSAEKALEFIKEARDQVDLVLTDVIMPVMNGVELMNEIRKIIENMKVILMSGNIFDVEIPAGEICLSKPFSTAKLIKCVRGALHGGQSEC